MDSSTPENKGKAKFRGKKRKRLSSGNSSDYEEVLPDNALVTEKNVHASAIKNNLDETSVRKILKKVVTNDHVLALVKLREEEEGSGTDDSSLQPLTRAKVKELLNISPKAAAWNLKNLELTPIKHIPVKTRPEVKALIAQELPEDEDDEEYEPTNDDVPSDDDQGLESCSDMESQPRTPATPRSLRACSPKVVQDGPFKVPQVTTPTRRKLDLEEEATIALRTRSKLSLSSTSIEHIESTFVPPDDLPMPAVDDDLWNEFLNECLNPASTSKHEDDDEADPEYNVASDPDANDEDEEALGKSIIKISKKELNDLMTELFNIMPETVVDTENLANSVLTEHSQTEISSHWEGKLEPMSDEERRENLSDRITFEKRGYTRSSIGKTEPRDIPDDEDEERVTSENNEESNTTRLADKAPQVIDIAIEERVEDPSSAGALIQRAPPLLRRHLKQKAMECVTIKIDSGVKILPEQVLILQQQIRQHIQLATSNYLQLYVHPYHWSKANTYKEYLESLSKLASGKPNSVANVCNLAPALELVNTWEKSLCSNTVENKKIVDFMYSEAERCRRRFKHKGLYVGEFHETLKQTIALSPVFLYPYLLPPMPYRAEPTRRYAYTRSEDELIALGLDQFWDYVEANPTIFKCRRTNSRQRWGLTITVQLVIKHMFPWLPCNVLLAHIQFVRKQADKDNPICKFFNSRVITPVKHKLLPFNPQISLYEQPEYEVPRIWVRYLAQTSKRFRNYLMRRTNTTGVPPQGLEVQLGQTVTEPTKAPLPIDFTKEIISNRINVLPKEPQLILADKFDIQIAPETSKTAPLPLFQLVETNTGAFLIPMPNATTTVNSNTLPITSPAEVATKIIGNNLPETSKSAEMYSNLGNKDHCSCCVLLRKICKRRQAVITDYFSLKKSSSCYCKDIKYPTVSNRLKLLVSNYKNSCVNALEMLNMKLKNTKGKKQLGEDNQTGTTSAFDLDEFVFVTSFHLKLLTRLTVARDSLIKRRVHTILTRFNPDIHDPVQLSKTLGEAFKVELVDMYKEFLCFLTAEQADKCDAFRDYFVRNCVQDLVKRVETQVLDEQCKKNILQKLRTIFYNNLLTACQICTEILSTMTDYPKLAQYVFSLFPHRKETRSEPIADILLNTGKQNEQLQSELDTGPDERVQSQVAMNYEADSSSGVEEDEECNNETDLSGGEDNDDNQDILKSEITTSDNEIDPEHNCKKISNIQRDSSDSSNTSMTIVFDEESVKVEGVEWKRDEDKLILEILKEHLTPEERKDKTIMETIVEKNIIDVIAENLSHKSKTDITSRVFYLLRILVLSEK